MARPIAVRSAFAALAVVFGFLFTFMLIARHPFSNETPAEMDATVSNIGFQMLSTTEHGYVLPFEVVSILLLASMIGCIVIAIKSKPGEE
jgi:NADH-quinone oxidoreductase subunit J